MAHVFTFSRNRADYDRGFHISMEATAKVFFNGDLDAAWEDLFRIGDETVARQNLPATEKSQPTEAQVQLRFTPPQNSPSPSQA